MLEMCRLPSLNWTYEFILESSMEENIMDIIHGKSKNSFSTIENLCKLFDTLRIKISCIFNMNHKDTISTSMEEINNKSRVYAKKLCN